jgi:nitroreductase
MDLFSLIYQNRSYRRFDGYYSISRKVLDELIRYSSYTASAMNLQKLRYQVLNQKEDCEKLFSCLKWAGYLKNWKGPEEKERPTAYLLQYAVEPLSKHILCDAGIALQTILLAAVEKDLGGCIFASVDKDKVNSFFPVEKDYKLLYAVAIGKPAEKIVIETSHEVKYWRDEEDIHHVPKRSWEDLIINKEF